MIFLIIALMINLIWNKLKIISTQKKLIRKKLYLVVYCLIINYWLFSKLINENAPW